MRAGSGHPETEANDHDRTFDGAKSRGHKRMAEAIDGLDLFTIGDRP